MILMVAIRVREVLEEGDELAKMGENERWERDFFTARQVFIYRCEENRATAGFPNNRWRCLHVER